MESEYPRRGVKESYKERIFFRFEIAQDWEFIKSY